MFKDDIIKTYTYYTLLIHLLIEGTRNDMARSLYVNKTKYRNWVVSVAVEAGEGVKFESNIQRITIYIYYLAIEKPFSARFAQK